jgi:hypothetical protein
MIDTIVGTLWNLAFNPYNVLQIVEEEAMPIMVHLCSSSSFKMTHFMANHALVYMFNSKYKCTSP